MRCKYDVKRLLEAHLNPSRHPCTRTSHFQFVIVFFVFFFFSLGAPLQVGSSRLIMPSSTSSHPDQRGVEPHPAPPRNINGDADYEPHPENSISISPARAEIQRHILSLYDGSASKDDMDVYAEQAVYDDPFSYCDTRY